MSRRFELRMGRETLIFSEEGLRRLLAENEVMRFNSTQKIEGEEPLTEEESEQAIKWCAANMPEHMLTTP